MLHLPLCDEFQDIHIHLDSRQEQELVEKLAKEGEQAIDELVRQEMKNASLREKIQRLREQLERQSSKIQTTRKERYERLQSELEERFKDDMTLVRTRQESAERDYAVFEKQNLSELEMALRGDSLIKLMIDELPRKQRATLWQRFTKRLRRFFLVIMAVFIKLFYLLFGKFLKKSTKQRPREDRVLIMSGAAGRVFSDFQGQLVGALSSNANFGREMDQEMKRAKVPLRDRVDRDSYLERAREVMEERVKQQVSELESKSEKERQELQEEIDRVLREEGRKKEEFQEEQVHIREEYEKEQEAQAKEMDEYPEKLLKQGLVDDLKKLGYLREDAGRLSVTSALIERFSSILLSHELRALPRGHHASFGRSGKKEGIYEKEKMLTVDEISRMDIAQSLINARISHPGERHIQDDDIIVNREHSEIFTHVVIAVDTSYSMLENSRMEAAKKAALALYKAIKRENPKNIIDLIGFNTHVGVMDLVSVWEAEPKGFTNTAGALRTAELLFQESKADSKLVYLVTDGLPEAYTNRNGVDVVDDPETCLPYALTEARKLHGKLVLILLEPRDKLYVRAAEAIARATKNSRMLITDPKKLAREMLEDFILA